MHKRNKLQPEKPMCVSRRTSSSRREGSPAMHVCNLHHEIQITTHAHRNNNQRSRTRTKKPARFARFLLRSQANTFTQLQNSDRNGERRTERATATGLKHQPERTHGRTMPPCCSQAPARPQTQNGKPLRTRARGNHRTLHRAVCTAVRLMDRALWMQFCEHT